MEHDPKTEAEKWYADRVRNLMNEWKKWRIEHPLKTKSEEEK